MSKIAFIELSLGNHIIVHGHNNVNEEITKEVKVEGFSRKIVAVSRIKSVSEKYILTDYADGRWVYWEYEDDYEVLKKRLI